MQHFPKNSSDILNGRANADSHILAQYVKLNQTKKNVTEINTQWKMMRHEIYRCCTFEDSKLELKTRSWVSFVYEKLQ